MRAIDSLSEIAQLRDRISELEREKAEVEGFAAVAAHELLTPVVMIDACAATVSDRLADACHEESRRDLAVLRRGCTQSRLLVECLLHQAAFRDRPLQTRHVELDALVRDCVALLGPEIRARGAQVQVSPLPAVDAEAPLISAVFMNLLVNALKYGPRLSPTVRVDATWKSAAWRFSVESEGQTIRSRTASSSSSRAGAAAANGGRTVAASASRSAARSSRATAGRSPSRPLRTAAATASPSPSPPE